MKFYDKGKQANRTSFGIAHRTDQGGPISLVTEVTKVNPKHPLAPFNPVKHTALPAGPHKPIPPVGVQYRFIFPGVSAVQSS